MLPAFKPSARDGAIAALAIPALGTLAMDPLVSIVDTAWVGRLGTEALAALAIASAVFAAVFSIFNFVSMTITPLVAGEVGRRDLRRAGDVTRSAIAVSLGVGVVVAIIAIVLIDPIVSGFGPAEAVATDATAYLAVRFLALPALLVAMVGHGVFRGHSDTRTPLYVAIGMNLANVVLDPVLIFGLGLGVVGAAWATVIAQGGAAVAFLVLILGTRSVRLGTDGPWRRSPSVHIGRILRAGFPMMIRSAALLAALTATTIAASRIGTAEVAAHQIALQVWLFMSFILDSYAVAAEAMVGTDLGRGHVGDARVISNRLLALGFVSGCALAVLLAVTAPLVGAIFSASPEVDVDLASIYPFVIVLQPLTALVYVWDGIGIGASAFRYLGAAMVVAFVLSMGTLLLVGGSLVGVWTAILVLSVSRLVALAWWHRVGPLAPGRGPSPSFRGA
jgi:MATE family, multidrug efflux pump